MAAEESVATQAVEASAAVSEGATEAVEEAVESSTEIIPDTTTDASATPKEASVAAVASPQRIQPETPPTLANGVKPRPTLAISINPRPTLANGVNPRRSVVNSRPRPALRRFNSSDATEKQGSIRHLQGKSPVRRALSGDGTGNRNFGSRPGMGGPGMMGAQKSMSTRFLDGGAGVFGRMASTRALFNMDDIEDEPSMITYMGREITASDYFDDDWLDDALNEIDGGSGDQIDESSSRKLGGSFSGGMDSSASASRRLDSSFARGVDNSAARRLSIKDQRKSESPPPVPSAKPLSTQQSSHSKGYASSDGDLDDSESESEVEEEMEDMEQDDSKAAQPIARRPQPRKQRPMRAKSSDQAIVSEKPAGLTTRAPTTRRRLSRSQTFDGTKTSEVLPRRRKAKSAISRKVSPSSSENEDHIHAFEYFLRNMGATDFGNITYTNIEPLPREPRPKPTMPKSRKKREQFRKLNYTADDVHNVLCVDHETFQRLKRVLTKKGAITNGILQQRLHIFLKKAKDRNSKAEKKLREDEAAARGEEIDDSEHDKRDSDWQAMSMMDMFAKSVRKISVDNNTRAPINLASEDSDLDDDDAGAKPWGSDDAGAKPWGSDDAGSKPWGGDADDAGSKPWGAEDASAKPWGADPKPRSEEFKSNEEPWKRRALPRQQAVLAKRKAGKIVRKSSNRSTSSLISMASVTEEAEREEEVKNISSRFLDMDASEISKGFIDSASYGTDGSNISGATGMDASRLSSCMDTSRISTAMGASADSITSPTTPKSTKNTPARQKSLSRRKGSRRPRTTSSPSISKGKRAPPSVREEMRGGMSSSERLREEASNPSKSQQLECILDMDLSSSRSQTEDRNAGLDVNTSGKSDEATDSTNSDAAAGLLVGWSH